MKINIVLQDLVAEFPHLIDKERFEVVETKEEGTWIVRKKELHNCLCGEEKCEQKQVSE